VTKAALIVFEMGNVLVSTTLTDPPLTTVSGTSENLNVKGFGGVPFGAGKVSVVFGGAVGKM
jgi:hypothetical protein